MNSLRHFLTSFPVRHRRLTSSSSYVPQIDGLRFLAIIPVLFWHAGLRAARSVPSFTVLDEREMHWFPNGHVGVELFFFISGYIIAFPFLRGRAPSLKNFYLRRLYRLEPPYFIAMIICFLMMFAVNYRPPSSPTFSSSTEPLWLSLVTSLAYIHGLIFHIAPKLNPPVWSLEVEIQFYILSPFLIAAYMKLARLRTRLAVGAFVLGISLIVSRLLVGDETPSSFFRWNLIGHMTPFILGILVSDVAVQADPFKKPSKYLFDLGMFVGLAGMAASGLFEERGYGGWVLLARDASRVGWILLIYTGATRGTITRKVLAYPWIAFLGGACYSIYLTHVPVMQVLYEVISRFLRPSDLASALMLSFGIMIPAALAVGMAFYLLIERPCMDQSWPARARGWIAKLATA